LVFERMLEHPPERVWRALTEHHELHGWHPTPFRFEPVQGGRVEFLATPGAPDMPDGEVVAFEPPRLLAYTWGEDELRFELRGHDEGSALTLTHTFDDRFKAARDAAGWEVCLQALVTMLAAGPKAPGGKGARLPQGDWQHVNSEYEQRFGIPHELATPPPTIDR
jgi:uncharacterized protein YndB with AHSA1/START domain